MVYVQASLSSELGCHYVTEALMNKEKESRSYSDNGTALLVTDAGHLFAQNAVWILRYGLNSHEGLFEGPSTILIQGCTAKRVQKLLHLREEHRELLPALINKSRLWLKDQNEF